MPFYIRAGKSLPVTCTEVIVRLRRAPRIFPSASRRPEPLPLSHQSRTRRIALGVTVMDEADEMIGQPARTACEPADPAPHEMDAYERVLGDAMTGDRTLFAREDYVEEAWRIVDPVLKAGTPVFGYEPGTWGPKEVDRTVAPPGGWQNPEGRGASDAVRGAHRRRCGGRARRAVHRRGGARRGRGARPLHVRRQRRPHAVGDAAAARAQEDVPWPAVHVFQVDERVAPAGDAGSQSHAFERNAARELAAAGAISCTRCRSKPPI